jgi:UDP-glucuronate 4-epimerase
MRIAVTGAAGFIGSHLCERLLGAGHEVLGIDAFRDNYPRTLKEANLAKAQRYPDFNLAELEVADPGLPEALNGADALLHLAARPGVRDPDAEAFEAENVAGTEMAVRGAARTGIRRVVLASSSSVYEPSERPHREKDPCRPLSPYGRSKIAAEQLAHGLAGDAGLELVVLRYFTVYGPRQRPDMAFARYIDAALEGDGRMPLFGRGNAVRDFTYVTDAVEATLLALDRGSPGATYNVSGGNPTRLSEALAVLGKLLGREPELDPQPLDAHEQSKTAADLALISELGFEPSTSLRDGLAAQVAAARAARPT